MAGKVKDPWEVVWWRDGDGNLQQVARTSAPDDWTEVTKGFPVDFTAGDETAAQSADSNKVEE